MTEFESNLYERLLTHFSHGKYSDEIARGRQEYEGLVAPLQTDDPYEEFRLSSFHNWYLFFRVIKDVIRTPAALVLEGKGFEIEAEEKETLAAWVEGLHSLFIVKKLKGDVMFLKNIVAKGDYKVENATLSRVFQKGEVIEAHVFLPPNEKTQKGFFSSPTYHMLPGVCVHPKEAEKYILQQAKKVSFLSETQHIELFMHLQKCKIKAARYQNVKIGAFYNESPLF